MVPNIEEQIILVDANDQPIGCKPRSQENPLKRLCTPQDVANAVEAIVNDPGKFLNGNLLYVTGGNHIK